MRKYSSEHHSWKGGFPKCIDCNKQLSKYKAVRCRECYYKINKGRRRSTFGIYGKSTPNWKGDDVKYQGLHKWLRNHYGKADKCENVNCSKKSNTFDWANVSGEYKRDINDYIKLCRSCHINMDRRGIKPLLEKEQIGKH